MRNAWRDDADCPRSAGYAALVAVALFGSWYAIVRLALMAIGGGG